MFKKLLLLEIFILFINYSHCLYDYNVTVYLGTNIFTGSKGNISATYWGSNGLYNYTEKLSITAEEFTSGDIKLYKGVAPWPIEYIEKIIMRFKSIDKSSIYIDKITINPIYLQNPTERETATRGYCSTDMHANVGNDKVPFWIKC